MASKGQYLIPSTKSSSIYATAPFDIVVAASGGDYTLPSAAFSAGGANKSYYIAAGTYVENADVSIPSGSYIYWEPTNGGVVLDFNNAANTFTSGFSGQGNTQTGTLTGATFSVGTADLADMEANPSLYKVGFKGVLYQVDSASDAANTITLTTTPVASDAGASYVTWGKGWATNITMRGRLSLTNSADENYLLGFGMANCDFSQLYLKADKQVFYLYNQNVDYGTCLAESITLTSSNNKCHYIIYCAGVRGKFVALNNALSDAGNVYGVLYSNSETSSIDICVISGTNAGAGAYIGLDGTGGKRSVITGVVGNVDTTTANVTNINTSALRTS